MSIIEKDINKSMSSIPVVDAINKELKLEAKNLYNCVNWVLESLMEATDYSVRNKKNMISILIQEFKKRSLESQRSDESKKQYLRAIKKIEGLTDEEFEELYIYVEKETDDEEIDR